MAEAIAREQMTEEHAHGNIAPPSIEHGNSSPCHLTTYPVSELDDHNMINSLSNYQGEMDDELRGNHFYNPSEFEEQTFTTQSQTEDPAHSQGGSPLEKMEASSVFDEQPTTDHVIHTDGKDGPDHHPHSVVRKRSLSPEAAKQISASPENSPFLNQSPSGHMNLSSQQCFEDPSHQDKRPSSPETSGRVKGTFGLDQISPSSRRTSSSPHRSQHLNRRSASPRVDRRQRTHRRSVSRSPTRKMESSSSHRRGHHGRSRSRSGDHQRSPRRRYSPRRRSPERYHSRRNSPRRRSPAGYHSRRHSPRRRQWSPPPNRRTGLGKPGNNLFVAGFSFLTTERDLERKFSRFGRVRDVRIVRDKRSGDSRGFGFLSLEKDEDADAAIRALDETEWDGRIILVEKSKST
ncbi:hypothetical protein ACFE04_005952 [Oxalis oulophora]